MPDIDLYVSKIYLEYGGAHDGTEDFSVLGEWKNPNYITSDVKEVAKKFQMQDGKVSTSADARRLFKVRLAGGSSVEVTVMQEKELNLLSTIILKTASKTLETLFGAIAGPAGTLSKAATGELFAVKSEWKDVFGVGNFLATKDEFVFPKMKSDNEPDLDSNGKAIDPGRIKFSAGGTFKVPLLITKEVKNEIRQTYRERVRISGTNERQWVLPQEIETFLKNKKGNGYIEFKFDPVKTAAAAQSNTGAVAKSAAVPAE